MTLLDQLQNLNLNELTEVSNLVLDLMNKKQVKNNYSDSAYLSNGLVCHVCGSIRCVKNGNVKGKQRFLCRDCGRTFGFETWSSMAHTKLSKSTWIEYIECMIQGFSIRKSAEIVGVCVKTSFYMRHKILDAISLHVKNDNVSGIIEMDETFLAESFKGNHKKSGFNMPREARKRGKEVRKRGISSEQICIGTAIDKNENIIMTMTCRGRITSRQLEKLYDGRVSEGSTICTDSYSSYKTLSRKMKLVHKQIPSGKHANDIFNLAHINSLHSRFKKWMDRFNGVSTKFLPNYINWFKWLESVKNLKESAKAEQLWANALSQLVDVRINVIRQREAVFV